MEGDTIKLKKLFRTADVVLAKAKRVNGEAASERTQELTQKVVYANLRILHKLGYQLEDIQNLGDKHIEAIVRYWWENKYAPKTMQNNFSRLKIFCGWMGKGNIVRKGGTKAYLPEETHESLKVKTYTEESKSWTENGVHVEAMLKTAEMDDKRWYCMLLLGLYFGLRQKEMLGIRPWDADQGRFLNVDGNIAKGGRPRVIVIEDNEIGRRQREVLEYVKKVCRKNEALCWPGLTMEQGRKRYFHLMRKHGLTKSERGATGHGLRAEYAENEALRQGLMPPSLGGTGRQMPKADMVAISQSVSNKLGHNDLHTISAYYGSFRFAKKESWGICGWFVLDEERIVEMYTDPPLFAQPDGSYLKKTEEQRSRIAVQLVLKNQRGELGRMGLAEFAAQFPEKEPALLKLLTERGLT